MKPEQFFEKFNEKFTAKLENAFETHFPTTANSEVIDLKEVNDLLKYGAELKAKELKRKKSGKNWRLALGAGFGALSLVSLLGAIGVLGQEPAIPLVVMGMLVLAGVAFSTLRALQNNPLEKLKGKVDETQSNLLKAYKKRQTALRQKQQAWNEKRRSKKMIMGLASTLADKMGIDPLYIRLVFIALLFATGGGVIPFYLLAGWAANNGELHKQEKERQIGRGGYR